MENQRIRLSKKLLKNALLELLREKRIDKISISELCSAAQINRTTFYKYYGNQYDLLAEMEQDFFRQLQENFLDKDPDDVENLTELIRFLDADQDRWKVLINSVGDQAFTEKLFDTPAIRSLFRRHSLRNVDPRTEGYVRTFFLPGRVCGDPPLAQRGSAPGIPRGDCPASAEIGVPGHGSMMKNTGARVRPG